MALWRGNVRVCGQIRESVSNEYEHLLTFAYEFLSYKKHINFGVSSSFAL